MQRPDKAKLRSMKRDSSDLERAACDPATVVVPPFVLANADAPARAVLLSVPHAGRYYPQSLLEAARVPVEALHRLEDRYVDRLTGDAAGQGFVVQTATHARAFIDLNRAPDEIDAGMVRNAALSRTATRVGKPSDKVLAGLGLFPRRLHRFGELWRGGFDWTELQARIADVHRPYHQALEQRMDAALRAHGHALLIDLHSMPGLGGIAPATLVIGDRHGATAPPWLVEAIEQEVQSVGLRIAYNRPYAGGYIIARHSRPARRRYAVQIEIDRTAYLDAQGQPERAACARLSALVARVATVAEFALAERFGPPLWSQAAE